VFSFCRFDPSHIPFAHHGIMGTASRDKAQPLHITTKVDVTPTGELWRWCCWT
jgi:phenylpropionate dioxygenase-like ring-hydroxylating dioxygenase large terminal subunit